MATVTPDLVSAALKHWYGDRGHAQDNVSHTFHGPDGGSYTLHGVRIYAPGDGWGILYVDQHGQTVIEFNDGSGGRIEGNPDGTWTFTGYGDPQVIHPVAPAEETPVALLPDPATVTAYSSRIESFLRTASERAHGAGQAIDGNAVVGLQAQWVAWRTERIARLDGVDQELAGDIARADWLVFAAELGRLPSDPRVGSVRVAAIKALRQWLRVSEHETLGLREARDWVDAYRFATNLHVFHLTPQAAAQLLAEWTSPVALSEIPDGAVIRFPNESRGMVIVRRTDSVFPSRIGSLEMRDVETGERFYRYAVFADARVTVLSGPPSAPREHGLDAI